MVMRGAAENDGYNALALAGGLGWRDVALIRTLSRFLRQIRVPFSQDYMWATLVQARSDRRPMSSHCSTPASIRARGRWTAAPSKESALAATIEEALQAVESLDEDRILRHFVNAVQSAMRTNFFQPDARRPGRSR